MSERAVDRNAQHCSKYEKQTVGTLRESRPKTDAAIVQFLLEHLSGFLLLFSFENIATLYNQAIVAKLNRQERFKQPKSVLCNYTIIHHLNKKMVTRKVQRDWPFCLCILCLPLCRLQHLVPLLGILLRINC